MRVAVIGAGVAGLACAHWLSDRHEVTLFEADSRLGGHTNTVRVDLADETHYVDTGFIVYNEANYPLFSGLLRALGVPTQASDMSFSVSSGREDFEYRGNGLGLCAQPANALSLAHARFLAEILRFNRLARDLVSSGPSRPANFGRRAFSPGASPSDRWSAKLADIVSAGRFSPQFVEHYLVPLGSAIWSADPMTFLEMPALTFARFFDNHGMLRLKNRPHWRTISGGAARYVEALAKTLDVRAGTPVYKVAREGLSVTLVTENGTDNFDAVVLATHSDQALSLLADPTRAEEQALGAIRYRENVATLHTDSRMLPRRRRAWASWNAYLPAEPTSHPKVTYWMNRLQGLCSKEQICVSLNRQDEVDPTKVLGSWLYAHPVIDERAVKAQQCWAELQGSRRTWYCGAYWGYGFHEDAVASAKSVARRLGAA